jgi:hypothetical protein
MYMNIYIHIYTYTYVYIYIMCILKSGILEPAKFPSRRGVFRLHLPLAGCIRLRDHGLAETGRLNSKKAKMAVDLRHRPLTVPGARDQDISAGQCVFDVAEFVADQQMKKNVPFAPFHRKKHGPISSIA